MVFLAKNNAIKTWPTSPSILKWKNKNKGIPHYLVQTYKPTTNEQNKFKKQSKQNKQSKVKKRKDKIVKKRKAKNKGKDYKY